MVAGIVLTFRLIHIPILLINIFLSMLIFQSFSTLSHFLFHGGVV